MELLGLKPLNHFLGLLDHVSSLHHYVVRVDDSLAREERPLLVLNESKLVVLALVVPLDALLGLLAPIDDDLVLLHERSDLLLSVAHDVLIVP
jgi:hypothetical protein